MAVARVIVIVIMAVLVIVVVIAAALVLLDALLEVGLRLGDLVFGRGAHLAHLDLEAQALAGERVVGVDHERVGADLEHAHHDLLAVGALGLEHVAGDHLVAVGKIAALDLEDRVVVALAEALFGLDREHALLTGVKALELPLEPRDDLRVAMHVGGRLALGHAIDRFALLVEEHVGERDERIRGDGEGGHGPERGVPRETLGFKPPQRTDSRAMPRPLMADPSASYDVPVGPALRGENGSARQGTAASGAKAVGPAAPLGAASGRGNLEKDLARVEGRKWLRWLVMSLVIAGVVAGGVGLWLKSRPPPPSKYVTGQTSKGDVFETVQSTGQVQPLTQVQVGAQVSGRVAKVYVDFNSKVKAGEILAEIDPTLFGTAIDQSRAQIAAATATVSKAEASLATAKQRLTRAKQLVAEGISSQADLDTAQGAYDVALADVAAARATVAQLNAQLRSSSTNLEYTRIFSPIEGVVITRSIDPGQTVAASFQAPVLFVIAQDLRKMRVLADIDEADVGKVREGTLAEVRVDAFPGEKFKGIVSQVRVSPNSQSGVVTYPAVIEVENPDVKLRPGMTATVSIRTAEVKDVMRAPNAALRFKPSPPLDKDGKKIPQDPLPQLPPNKGRVYVLVDATPGAEKAEPREVDVGITDGVNTEIKTDLGGVKLVTDENDDPTKKGKVF